MDQSTHGITFSVMFMLWWLVVFLGGVAFIAFVVRLRYSDRASMYPLFAVRDRIIGSVVFDGLDRDDPWIEWTYNATNAVLRYSHLLSGPGTGWTRARQIARKNVREGLPEPVSRAAYATPETEPPEQFVPVLIELTEALDHLHQYNLGFGIVYRSFERARRQAAKRYRESISASIPRGACPAG